MTAYCMLMFLPMLVALPSALMGKPAGKTLLCAFFVMMLALLCLRSPDLGRDLPNYKYHYDSIAATPWRNLSPSVFGMEWGYVLLNKLASSIWDNFSFFLAIVALLEVLPIAFLYKKESELPLLTILLYVNMSTFSLMFSGLRQSIAIALGVIAFYYTKRKQPIRFIVSVMLISYLFHISAFVLIFMYPAYHIRISKRLLPVILMVFFAVLVSATRLFSYVLLALTTKYQVAYSQTTETGAYTFIVLLLMFTVFAFVFEPKGRYGPMASGLRNFLLICLFIQAFAPIHNIAMRFAYYYLIFLPLLIPFVVTSGNRKYRPILRMAYVIMAIFFLVYFFISLRYRTEGLLDIYPYESLIRL